MVKILLWYDMITTILIQSYHNHLSILMKFRQNYTTMYAMYRYTMNNYLISSVTEKCFINSVAIKTLRDINVLNCFYFLQLCALCFKNILILVFILVVVWRFVMGTSMLRRSTIRRNRSVRLEPLPTRRIPASATNQLPGRPVSILLMRNEKKNPF